MKVCSKAFLTSIINDIFMQVNLLESHVEEFLESKGDVAGVLIRASYGVMPSSLQDGTGE